MHNNKAVILMVSLAIVLAVLVTGSVFVTRSMNRVTETTGASSTRVDPGSNMDKVNRDKTGTQRREPLDDNNVPPSGAERR